MFLRKWLFKIIYFIKLQKQKETTLVAIFETNVSVFKFSKINTRINLESFDSFFIFSRSDGPYICFSCDKISLTYLTIFESSFIFFFPKRNIFSEEKNISMLSTQRKEIYFLDFKVHNCIIKGSSGHSLLED